MAIESNLLSVGDAAPDSTLLDEQSRPTQLSGLWQRQPILLIFVRHAG